MDTVGQGVGSSGNGDGGSGVGVGGRGNDVVGDGNGGADVADDGGDGSVGMALVHLIGEVAAKTVRLDDGAVQRRGPHQGGGGDDSGGDQTGLGGGQANQQNSQLMEMKKGEIFSVWICALKEGCTTYDLHDDEGLEVVLNAG